jgi:hypothetical protein
MTYLDSRTITQNCLYFVELMEASIMHSRLTVVSFLTVTLDSA